MAGVVEQYIKNNQNRVQNMNLAEYRDYLAKHDPGELNLITQIQLAWRANYEQGKEFLYANAIAVPNQKIFDEIKQQVIDYSTAHEQVSGYLNRRFEELRDTPYYAADKMEALEYLVRSDDGLTDIRWSNQADQFQEGAHKALDSFYKHASAVLNTELKEEQKLQQGIDHEYGHGMEI